MPDTPLTRRSTQARLGPWYVLQDRNPAAPGMSFATLLTHVRKGQITSSSIVRGPTTQQMWTFAARTRGLSREFGLCWRCAAEIPPTADLCPDCHHPQQPPAPDAAHLLLDPATPSSSTPAAPSPPTLGLGDTLISVQDLATAFNLKLAPEPLPRTPPTRADDPDLIAPAEEQETLTRPGHPRRRLKLLCVVLLILATGVAILLYTREDPRLSAMTWLSRRGADVQQLWHALDHLLSP
jgi:hypothetical protein